MGNTPVVPHPVAPVVNVNVTRPEIHVVSSKAEAEALPDGSYYFLIEHATTTATLIAHVGGSTRATQARLLSMARPVTR